MTDKSKLKSGKKIKDKKANRLPIDEILPKSSNENSEDIKGYKKIMVIDTPEELRKLVKRITKEELRKIGKEDLKSIYEKAKDAYPDSMKKISRKERENLYCIQEELYSKLDPALITSLEGIGETLVKNPGSRKKAIKYNLPGTGAVLVKEWKGKKLEVKITDGGFEYCNKIYKSLSNLAKEISGYAVSGPIFFGLRKPKVQVA